MSAELDVDGRTFVFDGDWSVTKYDEWAFHRNQMNATGAKAVDIVALDAEDVYLIEVKDYTHPETERVPIADLPLTVAQKARDTLAGLVAAQRRASRQEEASFAAGALRRPDLHVVLHVELPQGKGGRLRNPEGELATLRSSLRTRARGIDPHAVVTSHALPHAQWRTRRTTP